MEEPTEAQQIALAVAPKVAGFFSMLGSGYIVYDILVRQSRAKDHAGSSRSDSFGGTQAKQELNTYHRLMVGLSLCDIVMSFGLFTSTWPMPKDTPFVWGAMGNTASCAAIGFLEQSGVAAVLYNGSLSIYYLLRIRLGWPVNGAKMRRVEPFMHAIPLAFGLATMVAGIPLKLYNSGVFDCWIAPFPLDCHQSWKYAGRDDPHNYVPIPCIRGDNASIYQWAFHIVPVFSSIFLITINMVLTYWSVRQTELKTLKYSLRQPQGPSTSDTNSTKSSFPKLSLSRRMARQSYLYVGALYITHIPVAITRLTQIIQGYAYYGMILTIALTIPLQGCWNLLIYLRPRYLQVKDRQRAKQRRREQQTQQLSAGVATTTITSTTDNDNTNSGRANFLVAFSEAVRAGELPEHEDSEDENDEEKEEVEDENEIFNDENEVHIQAAYNNNSNQTELHSDHEDDIPLQTIGTARVE